jgi:hypothetical protein
MCRSIAVLIVSLLGACARPSTLVTIEPNSGCWSGYYPHDCWTVVNDGPTSVAIGVFKEDASCGGEDAPPCPAYRDAVAVSIDRLDVSGRWYTLDDVSDVATGFATVPPGGRWDFDTARRLQYVGDYQFRIPLLVPALTGDSHERRELMAQIHVDGLSAEQQQQLWSLRGDRAVEDCNLAPTDAYIYGTPPTVLLRRLDERHEYADLLDKLASTRDPVLLARVAQEVSDSDPLWSVAAASAIASYDNDTTRVVAARDVVMRALGGPATDIALNSIAECDKEKWPAELPARLVDVVERLGDPRLQLRAAELLWRRELDYLDVPLAHRLLDALRHKSGGDAELAALAEEIAHTLEPDPGAPFLAHAPDVVPDSWPTAECRGIEQSLHSLLRFRYDNARTVALIDTRVEAITRDADGK